MKKAILLTSVLILAGISIFVVSSPAFSVEPVVLDGKRLIFPEKTIDPADISGLKFNLQLPDDKRFIKGKVYRAQFIYPRGFNPGPLKYLVFTKWTVERIEIFWWPVTISQTFFDCSASDKNSEFKCKIRGEGSKFNLFFLFRFENDKITILPEDGAMACLEPAGEIPAQFINEHKAD